MWNTVSLFERDPLAYSPMMGSHVGDVIDVYRSRTLGFFLNNSNSSVSRYQCQLVRFWTELFHFWQSMEPMTLYTKSRHSFWCRVTSLTCSYLAAVRLCWNKQMKKNWYALSVSELLKSHICKITASRFIICLLCMPASLKYRGFAYVAKMEC